MIKKQGITVAVMVITIIILIILAGTITVSSFYTISYSKLSSWVNEIMYIQDVVNEELSMSSATDYILGEIKLSTLKVGNDSEQFEGETINADNTITLKVLDLGELKITSTTYGNKKTNTDVYALSTKTGRVYYVDGIKIDDTVYYSPTSSLNERFALSTGDGSVSSVVFIPSIIGYTNHSIGVKVRVPKQFSEIQVSVSNNLVNVGAQADEGNIYTYDVNTNNIEGNYKVTVKYNDGKQVRAAVYDVEGYDITAPAINPVTYDNLLYRETDSGILDYLTNVNAKDESGIKVMKYAVGKIESSAAKSYFEQNGNIVVDKRINLNRSNTIYTIYAEDNAGNYSVLTFDKKYLMPEEWRENVIYIQDRVPIPKGFVASNATGENTKVKGLVIYEGDTPVTNENVEQARLERNQYVWVPVPAASFKTVFYRRELGISYEIVYDALGVADKYWEVAVDANNMPLVSANQDTNFMSAQTLDEVQNLYESVREYEGFYIARYEAGIDKPLTKEDYKNRVETEEKVYSVMGKYPFTFVKWGVSTSDDTGGATQISRSIYSSDKTSENYDKYGVVSTLTYGVQWDATLQWFQNMNVVEQIARAVNYGNYINREIHPNDLNSGAKYSVLDSEANTMSEFFNADSTSAKDASTGWLLTTGALKVSKVNNIYDMAGNVFEWTMEGNGLTGRTIRGGSFENGNTTSFSYRNYAEYLPNIRYRYIGFRPALYIKTGT